MEVSGELHAPAALPSDKETLVPNEQETGWASGQAWTLWCRENFLAPDENRTPIVQPVARRYTELSRLLNLLF
jgi:hypothetical protein